MRKCTFSHWRRGIEVNNCKGIYINVIQQEIEVEKVLAILL